jgi:hypothetical protein
MYDVNNNSSSSSSSSNEEETFFQIKTIFEKYRIEQDMKNEENCGYYAIMSQAIPEDYGGNFFGPQIEIPDDEKKFVNVLKTKVRKFNEIHLNNQEVFDLI